MKAIQVSHAGAPSVLQFVDLPAPTPGPGQVLIKVAAAGVNYSDTLQRRDQYVRPMTWPAVLGAEVAGTIASVGPDAGSWQAGQRVMGMLPQGGGYAEYAAVSVAMLMPVPDEVGFPEATALLVQGLTAVGLLRTGHYETVLVLAATGGVGSALVQLAKAQGKLVVAGVGGPDKLAQARTLGADAAVDYTAPDWVQQVRDAVGGQGVAASFDAVGGAVGTQALGALAPGGTAVVYGMASGEPTTLTAQSLIETSRTVRGYTLYADLAQVPAFLAELVQHRQAGRLQLPLSTYPFAEVQTAHRDMEGRHTQGKVVLVLE
ncbi:zinc-binding dehydrogenase [Hymenobacter sp. UYCo722]|uniref:quinone oxidoreductase family protein n=1 Tax=Hymenobacter sp. UYCo722 TaxID=3156335 RepID=UPI00339AF994